MTSASIETFNLPKDIKKLGFIFLAVLGVWLMLVHEPLWSAITIWVGNEIYNHCLIVIPASIYLVYERRKELDWSQIKFSRLATFVFILQLVFYILSSAAGIRLFQHLAIFSMLPTLVWMFIGTKLAWQIRFPLFFVLFSVPVGEELIPFLQELTADLSVFLLDITGIPLFRSGLYIEIPQGKFLVAEACSGVSFLIASIVLGNLYANMYLVSWRTRILFVMLSVIFPIAANAVRVYGIIYIGYATDMEHAVGADHLIYGWFFFAFVLICMFFIGEAIRKREQKWLSKESVKLNRETKKANVQGYVYNNQNTSALSKGFIVSTITVAIAILVSVVQVNRMDTNIDNIVNAITLDTSGFVASQSLPRLKWEPRYVGNNQEEMFHLDADGFKFELYFAFFNGSKGELVSSLHRLYNQDRWTLIDRKRLQLDNHQVLYELTTSSVGLKKEIIYWYWVDGKIVDTYKEAKFIEFLNRLQGEPTPAAIIAVAVNIENDTVTKVDQLSDIATQILTSNFQLLNNDI